MSTNLKEQLGQGKSNSLTRTDQLKTGLLSCKKQIQSLLQNEDKANRFLAASLVVAGNKNLLRCSTESIVQSLVGIAMSDLNVDPNIGHAYLVPYGESCQLQIGYKGFIQLLHRANWLVKAFPVYSCDYFHMEFDGWENKVSFKPDYDKRNEGDNSWVIDNMKGIYVVSRHATTKEEHSLFVSKAYIEKLRLISPGQKITQYTKPEDKKRLEAGLPIGTWADWPIEMATAKAIKKLAKQLPIGDSLIQSIIAADDRSEVGKKVDYSKVAETGILVDLEGLNENSIESTASEVKESNVVKPKDESKVVKTKEKPIERDFEKEIKEAGDRSLLDSLIKEMKQEDIDKHYQLIEDQLEFIQSMENQP
jgi:recombination protein RecT